MTSQIAVLCVDDEKIVIDSLKRELTQVFGDAYVIEVAQSGDDAFEAIRSLRDEGCDIAVALVDYILRNEKGDDLLRRIHDALPQTKTIMLTGQATPEGIGRAVNYANLYRFIAKPWHRDDLALTIKEAIRSYLQQQELDRANRQLEEYAQSLEEKVAQRTETLRLAMAELERAKDAAEVANRAKTMFLANMGHELRTPLNAVLGFAHLLTRSPNLSMEEQENLSIINRSGEHLLTLINEVLEMSKIETGDIALQERQFDLFDALDELEAAFRLRAAKKGLLFQVERAADAPRCIRADEGKLRQTLTNLLHNAITFTETGGVTMRLRAVALAPSLERTVNRGEQAVGLRIEIEDTGVGIAPEDLARVFTPFYQTRSGQMIQGGAGLGLSISQQFLRMMGGEIRVSSAVGRGTRFQVDLPVTAVVTAEAARQNGDARRVIGLAPEQPVYRVLAVDAQDMSRQLVARLLRPLGFEVREADSGEEAYAIWRTWQPHLIWLDIHAPDESGCDAARQIKATEQGRQCVIIGLTASSLTHDRAQILAAGCDDVLLKPFSEAAFFEMIAAHLGARFVYEDIGENAPLLASAMLEEPQLPAALAELPDHLFSALKFAVSTTDMALTEQLIGQIQQHHAALADTLRYLADTFDYPKLTRYLEMAERRFHGNDELR